jgi:hypothetical protein
MAARRDSTTKKFPKTATIERRGIALCESVVTDMGFVWREKGVDLGIDGEIELIDAGSAMGRVLWVQCKAQHDATPFPGENDRGFTYTCRQVDINYWLSGTAEVLLVCAHPESREAWFKHVHSWFRDPARLRDRKVHFDKAADRFDASAARRLLELGVESAVGIYLSPPPRDEELVSNLLAVDHLASTVHHVETKCRGWAEAGPRLVRAGTPHISDVVFHGGEAWSFRRFDVPPLNCLADGAPESLAVDELADSTNPADELLLRRLLYATLKDQTGRDLKQDPDTKHFYFKAFKGQADRRYKTGSRRGRGRTVVKRYEPSNGDTWTAYTRHMAFDCQFLRADRRWYVALLPTYHFTSDGDNESPFAPTLLTGIKQIEGHEAIRSQTRFWAEYLAGRTDLFTDEQDPRLRFGELVTTGVDRGIDDRSWKPLTQDELEVAAADGDPRLFDVQEIT